MKTLSINQLLTYMSNKDNIHYFTFNELLEIQHQAFDEVFEIMYPENDQIILTFESESNATSFYMEQQFGRKLLKGVKVSYNLNNPKQLILKPVYNIISLIDERTPGLCTLSKELKLNFKLEYQQSFSNNQLSLYIHDGEIINSNCLIRINRDYPILSLGRLFTLMRNRHDFFKLNTVIELVESETIYGENSSCH